MKILITGIAGLLGSRLADWLIENTEHTIIGVDDLSGGYKENINPEAIFYKKNLANQEDIEPIFKKHKPDIVYHFAAYAAEGLSPFIRKYNYTNNLLTSANLITFSIKYDVNRFVFTSSMSVYGDRYEPPFNEDMQQCPIDPYGVAKFSVEQDLKIAYEQHGLNYTIVQPTIFGDGSQMRAFSYVDDSIIPFWNASQRDECIDEIINLGGIKEYTIQEACDILLDVTGTDLKPSYHEFRHEAKHAWATWDKSVRLLDFEHKTDLKEGLTKMWEWAQTQPNRDRFVWPSYELEKGIYSYWRKK